MAIEKRTLHNLLLLLAVAILATVTYLEPWLHKEDEAGQAPLSAASAERASKLVIEPRDGEVVTLVRRDGRWWVERPDAAVAASPFQIDRLFRLLEAPRLRELEAAPERLAEYELDPPLVAVTVDGERFAFGGLSPVGFHRYVLAGERVVLIEGGDPPSRRATWVDFVDRQLLPGEAPPVALSLPEVGTLRLEEGRWRLEGSETLPDEQAVADLIDGWRGAQAIEVEALEEAGEGGETIVIERRGGETVRFVLRREGDELLLDRPEWGVRYRIGADQARTLLTLSGAGEPSPDEEQ